MKNSIVAILNILSYTFVLKIDNLCLREQYEYILQE